MIDITPEIIMHAVGLNATDATRLAGLLAEPKTTPAIQEIRDKIALVLELEAEAQAIRAETARLERQNLTASAITRHLRAAGRLQ